MDPDAVSIKIVLRKVLEYHKYLKHAYNYNSTFNSCTFPFSNPTSISLPP